MILSVNLCGQDIDTVCVSKQRALELLRAETKAEELTLIDSVQKSVIVNLNQQVSVYEDKVTDLNYAIDNLKIASSLKSKQLDNKDIEIGSLKKQIRVQKLQKILIVAGAIIGEALTIYSFTHGKN